MTNKLHFTKMHGLGNDFIFIKKDDIDSYDPSYLAKKYSDRHISIGCDQFILYEVFKDYVQMDIYNSDGSTALACGNATRCLAALLCKERDNSEIEIRVGERRLNCSVDSSGIVSVNMGEANFNSPWIPEYNLLSNELSQYLSTSAEFCCVDMGNPHLVIIDQNLQEEDMGLLGPRLEKSNLFPGGVNVNFVKLDGDTIKLKVWERGVGFTYACGSGACASFAVCNKLGFLSKHAEVKFLLGSLYMEMENDRVKMSGKVSLVAEGVLF